MRKYFLPKNTESHDSKSFNNIFMTAVPFLTSPYTSFLFKLPCKREKIQPAWTLIPSNCKGKKNVTDIMVDFRRYYYEPESQHRTGELQTFSTFMSLESEVKTHDSYLHNSVS